MYVKNLRATYKSFMAIPPVYIHTAEISLSEGGEEKIFLLAQTGGETNFFAVSNESLYNDFSSFTGEKTVQDPSIIEGYHSLKNAKTSKYGVLFQRMYNILTKTIERSIKELGIEE